MAPAIAIYASAAAAKPSEPTSATSTSTSKPATGGLSLLFSSSSSPSPPSISRHVDELSRSDEIGCSSYSYSSFPSSFKLRDHLSPISVFQPPSSSSSSSRSPPTLWASQRYTRDRLFNSFVRNALGSCLDYVPLSPSYQEEGPVGVLGFDLEDGLNGTEPDCDPCAKEMLADAQSRHNIFHDELVVKAFFEAEKAHRGQMRASGDPYLQHCVETAIILADIGANSTVISAGLLHDTIDDSFLDYEHIFNMFRANVADLVEGVSKLSHLSKLARENDTASRTEEADRLHTMFLAMNDPRAVLIKLADRLHNMMTLDALTPQKQQRFAKETLEIFVPLAHRLGISSWKEKLENICFKFLYPEKYEEISSKLENSIDDDLIIDAVDELEKCLNDEGIAYCHLSGRNKSLYSIHSKMLKKKISMDEILDIHGLRLVVEKEEDCYKALEIVHKLWPRVNGRYKDYISHPKRNGYKSLHTVVLHTHHHPLEIQIRTRDMHFQAEYGYAAHWSYKEGSCKYSFIPHLIQWGRWVATWQCETLVQSSCATSLCKFPSHSDDCPYSYTPENKDGPVFVIMLANEKMCVHEFPANSTVRDLLERVGVGSSVCSPYSLPLKEDLRTWVNQEPVNDQTRKLNMGDFVTLTSLSESREKIQRMYNGGIMSSSRSGSGSSSGSYWGN